MKTKKIKNKMGRSYAITKEKEEILIRLISDGVSQNEACRYVGISKQTIIRHKKRFPSFVEKLERAKLETTKFAHKSIKLGMTRDWRAGAWWLERTNPKRFREKKELEVKEKRPMVSLDGIFGKNG